MGGLGRTIRTPPTASAPRCWGIYRAAQRIIHVRPPTVQVAPTLTQNTHTTSNTCGPNACGKPPADGLARAFPDCDEAKRPRRFKTPRFRPVGLSAMFGGGLGNTTRAAPHAATAPCAARQPAATVPVPAVDQRTRAAPTRPTRHDRRAGRATTADARAASLPLTPTG